MNSSCSSHVATLSSVGRSVARVYGESRVVLDRVYSRLILRDGFERHDRYCKDMFADLDVLWYDVYRQRHCPKYKILIFARYLKHGQ
jgi:hypothetical protein